MPQTPIPYQGGATVPLPILHPPRRFTPTAPRSESLGAFDPSIPQLGILDPPLGSPTL